MRSKLYRQSWFSQMALCFGLAGLLALACANRGMQAPDSPPPPRDDGPGGSSSTSSSPGGTGGRGGSTVIGGEGAPGPTGSAGGGGSNVDPGGAGGMAGTSTGDSDSDAGTVTDAGTATDAGTGSDAGTGPQCATPSARFGFEVGTLHGARINVGDQTAFTAINNTSDAVCGGGALAIATTLTTTQDKGEVIIPFAAPEEVAGKTVSITFKATSAGPPNALALVFLIPSYTVVAAAVPLPDTWTTKTMVLPAGADAGTSMITGISIQLLGRGDSWSGTILVDEIDLE